MKIQESAENYLETILMLSEKQPYVRSIDIATELGFSKPSVSVAMKNLRVNNLILVNDEGHITLTDEGRRIAETIYERHTALSKWLMDLGVSEKTALEDACRIEHDISAESFAAIKEHIKKYYDAFKTCNDPRNKGDLTPFILMFLDILKISMEQLISGLEKRKNQLEYYRVLLGKFAQSKEIVNENVVRMLFVLIQAELFSERGISTQELLEFLEISRSTLKKFMEEVDNYGLIKKVKRGNRNFFAIQLEELEKLVNAV